MSALVPQPHRSSSVTEPTKGNSWGIATPMRCRLRCLELLAEQPLRRRRGGRGAGRALAKVIRPFLIYANAGKIRRRCITIPSRRARMPVRLGDRWPAPPTGRPASGASMRDPQAKNAKLANIRVGLSHPVYVIQPVSRTGALVEPRQTHRRVDRNNAGIVAGSLRHSRGSPRSCPHQRRGLVPLRAARWARAQGDGLIINIARSWAA